MKPCRNSKHNFLKSLLFYLEDPFNKTQQKYLENPHPLLLGNSKTSMVILSSTATLSNATIPSTKLPNCLDNQSVSITI